MESRHRPHRRVASMVQGLDGQPQRGPGRADRKADVPRAAYAQATDRPPPIAASTLR